MAPTSTRSRASRPSKRSRPAAARPMRLSRRSRSLWWSSRNDRHRRDCFCLVAKPGQAGGPWGYNGSGPVGRRCDADTLIGRASGPRPGAIHAVTVRARSSLGGDPRRTRTFRPGPRARAGDPARPNGFPVAPRVALMCAGDRPAQGRSRRRAPHLRDGRAPAVGDVMTSRSPRPCSGSPTGGAPAFYQGAIGKNIAARFAPAADCSRSRISPAIAGRPWCRSRPAIAGSTWTSCRQWSGTAALVLPQHSRTLRPAGLDPMGPERLHILLEAARLGLRVRDTHVADRAHAHVGPAAARQGLRRPLADRIDPREARAGSAGADAAATPSWSPWSDPRPHGGSLINSLYSSFRRRHRDREHRIMLQNRGACFVSIPTIPTRSALRNVRCIRSFRRRHARHALRARVSRHGGSYQSMARHVVSKHYRSRHDVQAANRRAAGFFEGDATLAKRRHRGGGRRPAAAGTMWWCPPLTARGGQAIAIDWERGVLIGGSDRARTAARWDIELGIVAGQELYFRSSMPCSRASASRS